MVDDRFFKPLFFKTLARFFGNCLLQSRPSYKQAAPSENNPSVVKVSVERVGSSNLDEGEVLVELGVE